MSLIRKKGSLEVGVCALLLFLCGHAFSVTPTSTSTHRWFPFRPVDAKPANPAQLVGVQIIDNGGFILTFNQDIDPICTAATAGNPSMGPKRLYFIPDDNLETSASSVRAALATALSALQSGSQVLVMYNFTSSSCVGRYLSIVK